MTPDRPASPIPLERLIQEIAVQATWEDLVLPGLQRKQLEELAARAARLQRRRRSEQPSPGLPHPEHGIGVIFVGVPGTRRTMAAEVLARALKVPLYRVDLAAVVSRYIGETEKNLARIFEAAERRGAILLFDEADELLGRRSEVKDAHDRHANLDVNDLLRRIENHTGLVILATNTENRLDKAFIRRLSEIVRFPLPDAKARAGVADGCEGPPPNPNMLLGLRTAIYPVQDLEAAKAWYATLVGHAAYFDQPFYVGFEVGGFELGLVPDGEPGESGPRPLWGVADAGAAFDRAIQLGATSLEPVQHVGEGIRVCAVRDPFGNRLGFIENPHFDPARVR